MTDFCKTYDVKMSKTIESVKGDFASVRAGRANAGVLDRIQVEYYGTPTPIQQVASISTPDPRTLQIQPWDGSVLKAIEKAIQTSDLGINPQMTAGLSAWLSPSSPRSAAWSLPSRCASMARAVKWPSATSAGTPWTP